MTKLIEELKRRHVLRFAGIYIVSGWVLLQVADVVVPAAGLPEWIITFVLYLVMLGFPFALTLAWMFNLTRKGVEQDKQDASRQPFSPASPVFIVALLVFTGSAYFAYKKALPAPDLTPSIAVLPFENLTGDTSQDFLADGITEEIMNSLFRLDNMKVISRTSVFAIKKLNLDLPEIGSRLKVENILEGNLKINGDAIRLAVRMINVATGKRMWAETFDGKLSDFEFQDNVTNTVTAAISGVFGREPPPATKAATREVLSREHYLRGRYYYEQRGSENTQRAVNLFQQAIDVDPLYADAWAAMGQAIFLIGPDDGSLGLDSRLDAIVDKALEIDPDNPRALTVKANIAGFRDWDFRAALTLSQQAVKLAPGSGDARHFHAIQLGLAGRHEEALAEQKIAVSLDPLYPPLLQGIGHRYRYMWRFEESIEFYQQSIRNGFEASYANLFYVFCNLGRIEEAAGILLRDGRQAELDNWDRLVLAYFSGDHEEAAKIYAKHFVDRRPPASEFHPSASVDAAYAGDFDYAFESLTSGAEDKDINLIRIFRSRKLSDEFYSDPRWVELWNHPNMKPLFDLYLEANETPWIPIMKAAIAKRETEST